MKDKTRLFPEGNSLVFLYSKLFGEVNFKGQKDRRKNPSCTKIGNGVLGGFGGGLTLFFGVLTSKNGVLRSV